MLSEYDDELDRNQNTSGLLNNSNSSFHAFDSIEQGDDILSNNGLFPGGTKVFPSKYHFSLRLQKVIVIFGIFSGFCLIMMMGSGRSNDLRSNVTNAFVTIWVIGSLCFLGLMYYWNKMDYMMYKEKVDSGLWLEGIFVFSTGDVVVRFNGMLKRVEKEFDSGMIVEAIGRNSEHRLIIIYTDLRGDRQEYKVDCKDLVNSPSEIASCINSRENRF